MKYRIYLWHTCWSIVLVAWNSNSKFEFPFCLVPFPKSLKPQTFSPFPLPHLAQPSGYSSSPFLFLFFLASPLAPCGPASRAAQHRRPTRAAAAPRAADGWGPLVIPASSPSPRRTRPRLAPPLSPTRARRPRVARTPRPGPQAFISRRRPLDAPTRAAALRLLP
jgi:hypothetical protein